MSVTIATLNKLKRENRKFACLTCYDSSFGQVMSDAEIEVVLIGDTLGMVIQGHNSTLPVTVDNICYHTKAVASSCSYSLIMADMPFMSARTVESSMDSAMQLMQAGAHMVKIEGSDWLIPHVKALKQNGVPVCAHLGLTP